MRILALVGVALALSAPIAAAQAIVSAPVLDDGMRGFVPVSIPGMDWDGEIGAPPSRVLFVNDCKPNGCPIIPGNFRRADDSRTNLSSIVRPVSTSSPDAPRMLAPYAGSAAAWAATIDCVRQTYAPFNISVVTTEPSSATSYFEVMAAGLPGNMGFPSGVLGVASFSCGVIPNGISFAFLNRNPSNVVDACWTITQESAHTFGLSHEMLAGDVMTYSINPPRKQFLNQTACIGTQGCCVPAAECQCGAVEQNSFQSLLTIFGPAGATPPDIAIASPVANASVAPGFAVVATIADANGVDHADLLIDGVAVQTLPGPGSSWTFHAPVSIATGPHTVAIHAVDAMGAEATATVEVTVAETCSGDGDCASVGEGYVCVGQRCVPGTGIPGGLGASCDGPEDCLSGQCATRGGVNHCSESCDPGTSGSCGDGFECIDAGGGAGLCWPGDGAACGCSSEGAGSPALPIGAGLVLSALLVRRRRRPV